VIEFRDLQCNDEAMSLLKGILRRSSWLIPVLLCRVAFAADANVAGTWTVNAGNGRRSVTQRLVLQQDGGKVTGTFKGPRQSGTVDGMVSGNAVKLHITAKRPIDYAGTVDGDNMKGTLTSEGKTGDFTAMRSH
jgi:hypothetical protein